MKFAWFGGLKASAYGGASPPSACWSRKLFEIEVLAKLLGLPLWSICTPPIAAPGSAVL